ncbi:M56 family metallopeptidase [Micromonospora sp. U56]|uniref:M56 family metallopeptidase n=1 Tax=Micromonospora sp. U56 TaxID=2824900 RepID=UPI001B398197|nr:M56 family metallopeptidase [Micromonospora sp. U56]MBQ0897024.1 M56 family metallopeptidase [Micromonospora sp. U56]
MTGIHLLLFAIAVSTLAPRGLAKAGWVYRSPRLGIAAWYAVLGAVLTAASGAVLAVVAPWQAATAPACMAWRWCVQAARGEFGLLGRTAAFVALLAGLGLTVRLLLTGVRLARAASARRRAHVRILAMTGRTAPELGATVVENAQPAAYVVAGHGRRVVVTTGALQQLAGDEVAAVLAHERAHAAGRHDLLLDGVRLLHQAFPRMALFAVAHVQLCRLVEMRADEVATARHAPISLARALVTMATANAVDHDSRTPALAGVVAATGGDAAERLHRLLTPPAPLGRAQRAGLVAGITMLALAPAVALLAVQVFPVLGMCPALPS